MNPQETLDLFGYMRGLYGRQFTLGDKDARAWHPKLERFSPSLVRMAVDQFVDQSTSDFPPNCPQLVRLCKTLKRNQYLEQPRTPAGRQLEHRIDWPAWDNATTHQLFALFDWEPRPPEPEGGIDPHSEKSRFEYESSEEFQQAAQAIRAAREVLIADSVDPNALPLTERQQLAGNVLAAIGATRKRKFVQAVAV